MTGPAASPGFHLWHAALAWKAEITRALEPLQLTATQFFVLGAIAWLGKSGAPPKQREVAELSGSDAMTVSQVVRSLERAGLVKRTDDPDDSRSWRLAATAAGARTVKDAAARVRTVDDKMFARAELDRATLVGALQRLGHGP